jgi:N utilization substance protein B
MAVQMLYQSDVGGSDARQIFASFDLSRYLLEDGVEEEEKPKPADPESGKPGTGKPERDKPGTGKPETLKPAAARRRRELLEASFEYAKKLVQGTIDHRQEIDTLIRSRADNWRLERMPVVDRNVLRLAVYEMLFEEDIPHLVVVDEAIELAKRFGSENSSRFVNGLLDGLMKQNPTAEEVP